MSFIMRFIFNKMSLFRFDDYLLKFGVLLGRMPGLVVLKLLFSPVTTRDGVLGCAHV